MQSFVKLLVRQSGSKEKCSEERQRMAATSTPRSTTFPPPGYQPTPINTLLAVGWATFNRLVGRSVVSFLSQRQP